MSRKIISLVLSICFLFQQTGLLQAAAVELNLSNYFAKMSSGMAADSFRPVHLRYFSYDSLNNSFKVLLDKGDFSKRLSPATKASAGRPGAAPKEVETQLKEEAKELLKYFLIGVTLPNDKFWVNLRPDSPKQIIDFNLEETDIGKIMLESDLQLKKDTALFTSPQTAEGKEYWERLYKKAEELYGNENITIPTLTRPWIVPNEIIVRETKDSAYIYKATLKVMLEQDYLKDSAAYSFKDSRSKALNEYSSQLIRELIIPKLTKEVNLAKRYAPLRQVYYSLILSRWFKLRFQGQSGTYPSLIDKNDLTNLTSTTTWDKSTYFNAYKKSFAQGEYNIKEPVYTPTGQVIRSYFSGGMDLTGRAASPMALNSLRVKGKISDLTNILLKNEGWVGFTGRENFPLIEFMSYVKSGDIQYYPPSEDVPHHSYFVKIPGMYKPMVEVYNPITALNIIRKNTGAASPVEKKPSEVKAKLLSELERLGLSIELIRQYIKMNNKIKPPTIVNAGDYASSIYYFSVPVDFGGQISKLRVEIRQYAEKKKTVTIFFDRYIIDIARVKDKESINFSYNYSSGASFQAGLREVLTKIDPERLAKEIMFALTGLPDQETVSISSPVEVGSALIKAAERILVTELSGITYKSIDSIEKTPIEIEEDPSGGQVVRRHRLEYMGHGLDIDLHKPLPGQEGPSHAILYFYEDNFFFKVTIREDNTKMVHISGPTDVEIGKLDMREVARQMKACLSHGEAVSSSGELNSVVFIKIQIGKIIDLVNEFLDSSFYFGSDKEFQGYFYTLRKDLGRLTGGLELLRQSKEKGETIIKSGEGIKENVVRDLLRISARAKSAYDSGPERKSELAMLAKISDESMRISKEIVAIALEKNETVASPINPVEHTWPGLKGYLIIVFPGAHPAAVLSAPAGMLDNKRIKAFARKYWFNDSRLLDAFIKQLNSLVGSPRMFKREFRETEAKFHKLHGKGNIWLVDWAIGEKQVDEFLDKIREEYEATHGFQPEDRFIWPSTLPGCEIRILEVTGKKIKVHISASEADFGEQIELERAFGSNELESLLQRLGNYNSSAAKLNPGNESYKGLVALSRALFMSAASPAGQEDGTKASSAVEKKGKDKATDSSDRFAAQQRSISGKLRKSPDKFLKSSEILNKFLLRLFKYVEKDKIKLTLEEFKAAIAVLHDVSRNEEFKSRKAEGRKQFFKDTLRNEQLNIRMDAERWVAIQTVGFFFLNESMGYWLFINSRSPLPVSYADSLFGLLAIFKEVLNPDPASAEEGSSPIGGIDFKHQSMASATTYEAMGSFAGLDFNLPKLSSSVLLSFNLDKEQTDITRAIDNGIVVSGQRIKEFMAASSAKGQLEQRRETVITWLAKLGILEETTCCTQESSREYREALVIADSAVI